MPAKNAAPPPEARPARRARTVNAKGELAQMAYTSFILHPDQLYALKQAALQMQGRQGGKADMSRVLRDALDAIATGGQLPEGLRAMLGDGLKGRPR